MEFGIDKKELTPTLDPSNYTACAGVLLAHRLRNNVALKFCIHYLFTIIYQVSLN